MRIDLDELERRAKAATPGKWTWKQVGSFSTPGCAIFWPDTSKGGVHYRRLDSGGGMLEDDANFIAAANPAVVLELVRRLREAEHDLQVTETQCLDGIQAQNELHEEILQLRTDAERYRLLKRGQHWSTVNGVGETLRGEALDQAIDAVRATQEAKSGD